MRKRLAIVLAAGGSLALSACAYDMYGDPYGYGYGPYGGAYGPYGYGYGAYDPFGWYGDYYYPGLGVYVYDRDRNRHVWNDIQRSYWTNRTSNWHSRSGRTMDRENWSGFRRHRTTTTSPRRRPSS